MNRETVQVLIVDDDQRFMDQLASDLTEEGFRTLSARDGSEAMRILAEQPVDVGLIDLSMPGMDGIELLKQAAKVAEEVPLIVITGHATVERAVQATRLGAYDLIEKPASFDRILSVIERAIEKKRLRQRNRWMAEDILNRYRMVGAGKAMQRIYQRLDQISAVDATVLITGETGTGKELAAMAIHLRSARADGPYVRVNCAAIPELLIESELFGYKKGAFTGASQDFIGRFRQADGGSLFLDEIADLSHAAQAKLLRCLQDHVITPLGSTDSYLIDVRVIAATNKNLMERVASRSFREDLYYRINVVELEMPRLVDRMEDLPELARHFLHQFCEQYNRYIEGFSSAALQLLMEQEWPGNVRQLRSVIERLALFAEGPLITAENVAAVLKRPPLTSSDQMKSYKQARCDFERDYIQRLLQICNGNVSEAADAMKIDRTNLYRKMKKLGISAPRLS
ncbi:MAG TPA: sigma-54 dependent transcriptional regulator [bacterium]|nr:sigma-54 dependent transcriptional regulator [bacterium]HPN35225.1 sigma-54 dependent transcriptional regulator [bacterium]